VIHTKYQNKRAGCWVATYEKIEKIRAYEASRVLALQAIDNLYLIRNKLELYKDEDVKNAITAMGTIIDKIVSTQLKQK